MELILWRHADADDSVPDRKRRLTPKGRKQARRVGKWLAKRVPERYRVLASPAQRAQETAAALTKEFETVAALAVGAPATAVLDAAGWGTADDELVIIVGHQPTLGEAAMLALTGHSTPLGLKKGALLWLSARTAKDGVSVRAAISPSLL